MRHIFVVVGWLHGYEFHLGDRCVHFVSYIVPDNGIQQIGNNASMLCYLLDLVDHVPHDGWMYTHDIPIVDVHSYLFSIPHLKYSKIREKKQQIAKISDKIPELMWKYLEKINFFLQKTESNIEWVGQFISFDCLTRTVLF